MENCKTRMVLKHMYVMYVPCRIEPLNASDIPSDLYSLFGPKLPDFVYFFMLEGSISPELLNVLISCKLLDIEPQMDSLQYRLLLNQLIPLRGKVLGLVADGLHPSFVKLKIVMVRWYDILNEYPIKLRFEKKLRTYRLLASDSNIVDLSFVLTFVGTMPRKKHPTLLQTKLETVEQIMFQILAEGLRMIGFENGEPLLSVFYELENTASQFAESWVIVMEMLKIQCLHEKPLNLPAVVRRRFLETIDPKVLFLSRLFATLPATTNAEVWIGKVDPDLLGFNQLVKTVVSTFRNLLDAIHLRLWLEKMIVASTDTIPEVSSRLPFTSEPSVAVGVLMKEILLDVEYTPAQAKIDFPNIIDPVKEVQRASVFWDIIFAKKPFALDLWDDCNKMLVNIRKKSPFFHE